MANNIVEAVAKINSKKTQLSSCSSALFFSCKNILAFLANLTWHAFSKPVYRFLTPFFDSRAYVKDGRHLYSHLFEVQEFTNIACESTRQDLSIKPNFLLSHVIRLLDFILACIVLNQYNHFVRLSTRKIAL